MPRSEQGLGGRAWCEDERSYCHSCGDSCGFFAGHESTRGVEFPGRTHSRSFGSQKFTPSLEGAGLPQGHRASGRPPGWKPNLVPEPSVLVVLGFPSAWDAQMLRAKEASVRTPRSHADPACLLLFLGPPGAPPGPGSRWPHHSPGGHGLCPALAPALGEAERQRGGCMPSNDRPPGQTPAQACSRGQPGEEAGSALPGPPEHQEACQLHEP